MGEGILSLRLSSAQPLRSTVSLAQDSWNQSTEQCLAHELTLQKVPFAMEMPIPVHYKGILLACGFRADFLVQNCVLVELKTVEHVLPIHEAQILTYMKLAKVKVGLLINFNSAPLTAGVRRFSL